MIARAQVDRLLAHGPTLDRPVLSVYLDVAIERVAETGGRVELVRGEAATRLRQAGGIGAILRF